MKKENLLTTIALSLALIPFYASAQATTTPTEAQVFTACSQAAIEVRDGSIGAARATYNVAMANALSARKEAEKSAVALADADSKKDAIRIAVDEYKKSVTAAQEDLTKSRKEAWSAFETNTSKCRDASKDMRKGFVADKKASSTEKIAEPKTMQATEKTEAETAKSEPKSLRESLIDTLKNFFKIGDEAATN